MSFYHEKRKRTWADRLVLVVVVGIAAVVIALSAHSTFRLANSLGLEPVLTSGLVEIFFATLLLIRGRQRATRRKVPLFLDIGYYTSFLFVTAVNVWGLAQENPIVGGFVGIAISSAMLLAENLLVWLIVHGDEPYRKSARDLMKEARQEIQEEKIIQRIEWMKWEARKPNLSLIREARKAEERRKRVVGNGLPEYFLQEPEPIPQIEAEPVIVQETAEIVPLKRPIGFHTEMSNTKNEYQAQNTENPVFSTIEHPSNTPKSNTKKRPSSNIKRRTQNKTEQVVQYVIELIEKNEKFSVSSVANDMGCARSTASVAIREAKEKMMK